MGKKPTSILKSSSTDLFAYPYLLPKGKADKAGYRGVNFRITDKKNIVIDFECYDQKGQRIKAKALENGIIPDDDLSPDLKKWNLEIPEIKGKIIKCIDSSSKVSKELLNNYVYGSKFDHKRKRTKYITFPVRYQAHIIDSVELDRKEVDQLAEPYFKKNKKTGKMEPVLDYDGEPVIQSSEDFEEIVVHEKFKKESAVERKKERALIDSMSAKERYEKGLFDNDNIFEAYGQVLYLNKNKKNLYTDNWKMAVKKLMEYRERAKPTENIKDLSDVWLSNFLNYLRDNGYSTSHPKQFDVFKDKDKGKFKGETELYQDTSFEKLIKNTKEVTNFLMENKKLPLMSLAGIKYEDFNLENVKDDTKNDFYLTKPELDKLFFYLDFKPSKKYTTEDLAKARDLFMLQFWFGGLRPNELLDKPVMTIDDGYGGTKVVYQVSKGKGFITNENPIVTYSELLLKKYDYDFERIKIPYAQYCEILKEIGKQLFNRTIIKYEQIDGDLKTIKTNVGSEFNSYFARRSFEQIMNDNGVNAIDVASFTGRKLNVGSLKHYRSFTYDQKKRVMSKIKPERK